MGMLVKLSKWKWQNEGTFQTYIAFDYRRLPPFAKIMQRFI